MTRKLGKTGSRIVRSYETDFRINSKYTYQPKSNPAAFVQLQKIFDQNARARRKKRDLSIIVWKRGRLYRICKKVPGQKAYMSRKKRRSDNGTTDTYRLEFDVSLHCESH